MRLRQASCSTVGSTILLTRGWRRVHVDVEESSSMLHAIGNKMWKVAGTLSRVSADSWKSRLMMSQGWTGMVVLELASWTCKYPARYVTMTSWGRSYRRQLKASSWKGAGAGFPKAAESCRICPGSQAEGVQWGFWGSRRGERPGWYPGVQGSVEIFPASSG